MKKVKNEKSITCELSVLRLHPKACRDADCKLPFCAGIKTKLNVKKQQQHQLL